MKNEKPDESDCLGRSAERFIEKTMKEKRGWQLCKDGPEAYEKYIVPAFSGAWAQDIVQRAALRKGDRVLDVGCGTGIVSRYAFKSLGKSIHITGVDINKTVIEKAREICLQNVIPIEWKQANSEALPFSDAKFNVVLCQQGLQYFSDQPCALTEINRVLVPQGRIIFSVWRSLEYFPFYSALHSALEKYVSEKAALMLSSAFALGDPVQLRGLFESAGFKYIDICLIIKQMRYSPLEEFLVGGFIASPFADDILALDKSKSEKMFQEIRNSVSNYMDDHGLAAPMECYVVSAVK
ncbi:MAG: methyltransferase domain-containing protein [Proteobacteria bacterium]|nr:methyltransferase domain-containing protein [Pseudomonadota bacterium]MBU1581274.1 methyltransferase domain-containing protein [Pseudomonadota bacterium]MBU2452478.1 methyltransferase domain-containing protein [Pseudomonadota bacterium]